MRSRFPCGCPDDSLPCPDTPPVHRRLASCFSSTCNPENGRHTAARRWPSHQPTMGGCQYPPHQRHPAVRYRHRDIIHDSGLRILGASDGIPCSDKAIWCWYVSKTDLTKPGAFIDGQMLKCVADDYLITVAMVGRHVRRRAVAHAKPCGISASVPRDAGSDILV